MIPVRSSHRNGLSALSLIVVLAIILLLLAMLLPAVFQVRQAAARTQSSNNLKQLAIAIHNANDVYRQLPPIVGKFPQNAQNWGTLHFFLLPFLEQDNLFKQAGGVQGQVWQNDVFSKPVPLFVTHDDRSAPPLNQYQGWLGTTNYPGNWMVFKEGGSAIPGTFVDGTSNVIMIAQRYQVCAGQPCAWGYPALYYWAPVFGYYSQGRFQSSPAPDQCDPALPQSIGSHIQVALGDASVRSLTPSISPRTWWFLCDPADGNALDVDFQE